MIEAIGPCDESERRRGNERWRRMGRAAGARARGIGSPKRRFGLNFPCFLSTSAAMGTVEFTGFEMMLIHASGQFRAMPWERDVGDC